MAKTKEPYDTFEKAIRLAPFCSFNRRCILRSGFIGTMLFTIWESRRTPDPALSRARSSRLRLRPGMPCLRSPPAIATIGCADNSIRFWEKTEIKDRDNFPSNPSYWNLGRRSFTESYSYAYVRQITVFNLSFLIFSNTVHSNLPGFKPSIIVNFFSQNSIHFFSYSQN